MGLVPDTDNKKTKKNAYKVLKSYRLLKRIAGSEFSPKVTALYSFEPRSFTGTVSNAIEQHVVRQLSAQQECAYIEKGINSVCSADHRHILIEKYCHAEKSDIALYIDLNYTETEFYRELEKAVLYFADAYKSGELLVFKEDKTIDDILGEN
ncbi:transcriptional regulator [Carnobacteriaceae bacterium zg-ZUI78]|nr:transcriptional regulator [Carnobacteriaceae bacterium zg-ZUI78]